jgi:hypothetical protein
MRLLPFVAFLSLVAVVACKSTDCCSSGGTCAQSQAAVEKVAKLNPGLVRLTVHCMMDGKPTACASTSADKQGKPSDPEDVKAMQSGQTVALDEAGALDVTVPILAKDGKFMGACGVTLPMQGLTREQAVAKATTIAKAVEAGLPACCMNGCSSGK